jgi:hypothetical protein
VVSVRRIPEHGCDLPGVQRMADLIDSSDGRVDMPSLRELAHEVRQVLPTRAPTVQEHDGRACSRFRVVE